jgi:hypothetical protein
MMLSCLLNLKENVLHTSEGELDGVKVTLESLSVLEQCNFRTVVSLAGAIRDAASFAWSSSRSGGADLQDHCDALRQIEIESGFVRASALGSIEAFSDISSTGVRSASSIARQISLQGTISKSTALTTSSSVVHGWIQEGDALFSPLSKYRMCLEAATRRGQLIHPSRVRIKPQEQSSENVHKPEDSSMTGVISPCPSEKEATSFERKAGFKVCFLVFSWLSIRHFD